MYENWSNQPIPGGPLFRFWFVWHDYTVPETERVREFAQRECKFAVVGKEVCPTTGRPHLQGFFNLKKKRRAGGLATELSVLNDPRVTIRRADGTDEQNDVYCSKDGNILVRCGTPSKKGTRSDLAGAIETLDERGLEAVAEEHPAVWVRYYRGLRDLAIVRARSGRDSDRPQLTLWLHGASGSGKTRIAYDLKRIWGWNLYRKSVRDSWWCGYELKHHHILLMDDIRSTSSIRFHDLLAIMDRYDYTVGYKGGSTQLNSELIICTSIDKPEIEYHQPDEPMEQLNRRITLKLEVTNYGTQRDQVMAWLMTHYPLEIDLDTDSDEEHPSQQTVVDISSDSDSEHVSDSQEE